MPKALAAIIRFLCTFTFSPLFLMSSMKYLSRQWNFSSKRLFRRRYSDKFWEESFQLKSMVKRELRNTFVKCYLYFHPTWDWCSWSNLTKLTWYISFAWFRYSLLANSLSAPCILKTAIAANYWRRHSRFKKRLKYWQVSWNAIRNSNLAVGLSSTIKIWSTFLWYYDVEAVILRLKTSLSVAEMVYLKNVKRKWNNLENVFRVFLLSIFVTMHAW